MVGSSKIVGIVLIVAGVLVFACAALFLVTGMAGASLTAAGMVLGLGFAAVPALILVGVGVYLLITGQAEVKGMAEVEKEKKILNMVQTQGKVNLGQVALELNASMDQVKAWVYDLVGKELFTGYIDWKAGVLIAKEASEMTSTKCPNCGGERELAGKGIVKCPYCGAELFLPK